MIENSCINTYIRSLSSVTILPCKYCKFISYCEHLILLFIIGQSTKIRVSLLGFPKSCIEMISKLKCGFYFCDKYFCCYYRNDENIAEVFEFLIFILLSEHAEFIEEIVRTNNYYDKNLK